MSPTGIVQLDEKTVSERSEIVECAKQMMVTDDVSRDSAIKFVASCRTLQDRIVEKYKPHVDNANKAHKDLTQARAHDVRPLVEAVTLVNPLITTYEKARADAEEKIRREADEKARKEAAAAQEREAKKLEKKGETKEAYTLRQKPVSYVPPIVPQAQGPQGWHSRKTYRARITDFDALLKGAAKKKELRHYVIADMDAIESIGRSTKGKAIIPGIEFYEEHTGVTRRR